MASFTIRYSVGNEHNPGDPWGRSELVIHADGSARLDHHFSRGPEPHAWAGHVDPAALGELLAALDRAGFPAVPPLPALPPDATLRRLALETDGAADGGADAAADGGADGGADGAAQQALVSWHHAPSMPGYAEAFDLLDAVIRQLSGDAVRYPTKRGQIVHGIVAV
ncbi:MAG: hypothetical protein JWM19_5077 [Actinomycetia bacterium]|nr:hypothetical protein [Actinomycetes bacterium]